MIKIIDCTGLNCPLPVLKLRKALLDVNVGEEVTLITTDPISVIDIPHFCASEGHHMICQEQFNGNGAAKTHKFGIRRGKGTPTS